MTNEYLRACLQTKETHYYMKETQQINCRPSQMKAGEGEGGVQLIHTQQSIPIFFWLHHPSLVLCSSSPSLHIQQFSIDQQTDSTCPWLWVLKCFFELIRPLFCTFVPPDYLGSLSGKCVRMACCTDGMSASLEETCNKKNKKQTSKKTIILYCTCTQMAGQYSKKFLKSSKGSAAQIDKLEISLWSLHNATFPVVVIPTPSSHDHQAFTR